MQRFVILLCVIACLFSACAENSAFRQDRSDDRTVLVSKTIEFEVSQAKLRGPVITSGSTQIRTPDVDAAAAFRFSNRSLFLVPDFPRQVQLPRRVQSWVRNPRLRTKTVRCVFYDETRGFPAPVAESCRLL